MDNKAYLDQIAVKGTNQQKKPIITPALIKFILIGLIAIVALALLLGIVKKANKQDYSNHQTLYKRALMLADKTSPINVYRENLKSSELRSWSTMLSESLDQLNAALPGQLKNDGADLEEIDEDITTAETANQGNYIANVENAYMSGMLDRTYAYETYYQISLLINAEEAVISKAQDSGLKDTLQRNIEDLTILEDKFLDYSNKH